MIQSKPDRNNDAQQRSIFPADRMIVNGSLAATLYVHAT
jgi:hypothetical protein